MAETKKRNNVGLRQIAHLVRLREREDAERETLWMALTCSLPLWVYGALELARFVIGEVL